jgi:hypothetical protein
MNRRRTPLSKNNANRRGREYRPWQDFARQDALLRTYASRNSLRPSGKQTLVALLGGVILATTVGACAVYKRYGPSIDAMFQKPTVVQQELTSAPPEIQSATPFMDALASAPLDSLGLELSTKNLGFLFRDGWNPMYAGRETLKTELGTEISLLYLNSLMTWEAGIEKRAEEGRYGAFGERIIHSRTGAQGCYQITQVLLQEYNKHHTTKYAEKDLDQYRVSMTIADWALQKAAKKRHGDLFLMTLDFVSGEGTTNYLLTQFDSLEDMKANLWKTNIEPKWNEDPNKRITAAMIAQAKNEPYQVAVLASKLFDLEEHIGVDPYRGLSAEQRAHQDALVSLGRHMLALSEPELVRRYDGISSTVADPRLVPFAENRLIRPEKFSSALLEQRLRPSLAQNYASPSTEVTQSNSPMQNTQ